jgi:hypothetical protein
MGVKFDWGRALSAGGRGLSDYAMMEQRRRQIEEQRALEQERYDQENPVMAIAPDFGFGQALGTTMRVNTALKQARLMDMMKPDVVDPAPTWEEVMIGKYPMLQSSAGDLRTPPSSGSSNNPAWDIIPAGDPSNPWNFGATRASIEDYWLKKNGASGAGGNEFGKTTAGDLQAMVGKSVGNIDPRLKEQNVTPGAFFTAPLDNSGVGYDPLNVIGRFSSAAQDSALAGRSPRDVSLAPQIAQDIGMQGAISTTNESLPMFNDMQDQYLANWPRTAKFDSQTGMISYDANPRNPFKGEKSYTQGDFVKKGAPGFEAFKAVVAPMISDGLSGVEVAAIKEHAKRKGLDFRSLITDIDGLSDIERQVAIKEVETGLDLNKIVSIGGRTFLELSDGTLVEDK